MHNLTVICLRENYIYRKTTEAALVLQAALCDSTQT